MPTILSTATALGEAQQGNMSYIRPIRPIVIGPKAELLRYSVASERTSSLIGNYDSDDTTQYSIPGFQSEAIFDADYSKIAVTFDNAFLHYATKTISDGNGMVVPDASFKNRLVADTIKFATYTTPGGTTYTVSSMFGDRGVKVGDTVYVYATVSSVLKELWTTVTGLVNNVVAASIATATANASNATTAVAGGTSTKVAGTPNNQVKLISADINATNYDGTDEGNVTETYTVTVTTAGTPTNARLQIRSASGNDDYDNVTPAAFAAATTLSSGRTLLGTFQLDVTLPVDFGVVANEFVLGQAWTVTATSGYTAVTATAGGTYTGTELDKVVTYTAEVTRGGKYQTSQTVAAPTVNPTPTTSTSGGTVAANTYHLKITFTGASGETNNTVTATSVVTTGATSTITVPSPSQPTGSVAWKIYLSVTGAAGTFNIQGATNPFGPAVVLTSYSGAGAVIPTSNTATYTGVNPVPPQITVTRDDGEDSSGPTDITATATAFAVGTKSVTISFNQTKLVKKDKWTIAVTTKANGALQTLVLNNDLVNSGLTAATDVNVKFFIEADGLVIPKQSVVAPYSNNWTINATTPNITVTEGIRAYDPASSWKIGGILTSLPIAPGNVATPMYLTYRQWLPETGTATGTVSDLADIEDALGVVDPDNPVAQAVQWALLNTPEANGISNGDTFDSNDVKYIVLGGDPTDADVWQSAIELISGEDAEVAYNLIPTTTDPAILALFKANVEDEAVVSKNRPKALWVAAQITENIAIVDESTNDAIVYAKLTDDPSTSGNQYTYLTVPAGNGQFVTNGVQANDVVRYQFGLDVYGNSTYSSYVVSSVISEDALFLKAGPAVPENTAIKVEIYRPLDKDDIATQIIDQAATYASRRVKVLWPDLVTIDGSQYPSYYLAASLGGLAGAIPGNQSMTKIAVVGPTTNYRTNYFNNAQLERLSENGVCVVQQQKTSEGGLFYVRHAVTTAVDGDINNEEEQAVRLLDVITIAYQVQWANRYGNSNLTDDLLNQLINDFQSVTSALKTAGDSNQRVGPMLLDAVLTSLRRHATNKSRAEATIEVTISYPFNKVELTLLV